MKSCRVPVVVLLFCFSVAGQSPSRPPESEVYLRWSAKEAEAVGRSTYNGGKVGSDRGPLQTERATRYKLRITWFTPEVIKAAARLAQLRSRLTDAETRTMVAEAQEAGDTIFLVEIDPNEGSGVIPADWEVFLHTRGTASQGYSVVTGREKQSLRKMRALQGVMQRNYDYEQFWIVCPLLRSDGQPLFSDGSLEAELVVRIHGREGRVRWPLPQSIRERTAAIAAQSTRNDSGK